jgi:hypothetical protein
MNSQQESKPADSDTQRPGLLRLYTLCVSGLGIALLLWSLSQPASFPPSALLFISLVAIAELTTIDVFAPQMVFSISSAICFATLLLFDISPAALAGIVGGLAMTLRTEIANRHQDRPRAPFLQRAPFNMSALGLAVLVGGEVYSPAGGQVREIALLPNLLPMTLAAVAIEIVNSALVVGAVSFQTSKPAFEIWKQNVSWAVPINILGMVIGGSGLAMGYQIAGILGLGVFFLPVVLTIYAHRLYVSQTKAQMARLEEIIAERINDLKKANVEPGTGTA